MKAERPLDAVWVVRDIVTKELLFVTIGQRYDQTRYTLLYSVSAREVHHLVSESDLKGI